MAPLVSSSSSVPRSRELAVPYCDRVGCAGSVPSTPLTLALDACPCGPPPVATSVPATSVPAAVSVASARLTGCAGSVASSGSVPAVALIRSTVAGLSSTPPSPSARLPPSARAAAARRSIACTGPPPRRAPRTTSGCAVSSVAVGRSAGSLTSVSSTNPTRSADQASGDASRAGGCDVIKNSARMTGLTSEYGARTSAISMAVMPSDQISVGVP